MDATTLAMGLAVLFGVILLAVLLASRHQPRYTGEMDRGQHNRTVAAMRQMRGNGAWNEPRVR